MKVGRFITFEGGEGTGKSTQLRLLAARLVALGYSVVETREPGGTPKAENLRALLVSGDINSWSAEAEALLNYAARDSHLNEVVRPALRQGKTVLCDRFMDSTRAYQGYAGGCSLSLIDELEQTIVGDTRPHLTLMFDLPPDQGLDRARARVSGSEDRFERKGLTFHQRLRAGFMDILERNPGRCRLIDASGSVDQVAKRVNETVEAFFG